MINETDSDRVSGFMAKKLLKLIEEKCYQETYNKNDVSLNISFIRKALKLAIDTYQYIPKIFNKYTDHGMIHSENVLNKIMEYLEITKKIDLINSFELMIILLSAYYHDLGMAVKNEEAVYDEDEYKLFSNTFENQDEKSIRNEYLRRNHAKRVIDHLNYFSSEGIDEEERVTWNWYINNTVYHVKKYIHLVCESHDWAADDIGKRFKVEKIMFNKSNLVFCAIMLRMGDLLDFDNTRTSSVKFDYEGFNKINLDTKTEYSAMEHEKHHDTQGFHFLLIDEKLCLTLDASPKKVRTYRKIGEYYDFAVTQMESNNEVLKSITSESDRLGKCSFPEKINNGINPVGFEAGRYVFDVDKAKVMTYFMGNKLYSDSSVFLRELLQNAVDTCMFRDYIDEYSENESPNIKIIFQTVNGERWLIVSDNGMGMDKSIIQNFFLKIGVSFYESNQFKDSIKKTVKKKNKEVFKAISKFGIGVLSCFMVSDWVEVLTKKRGKSLYHLQLESAYGDYMLRKDDDINSFACIKDFSYLKAGTGTQIAIKLHTKAVFSRETIIEILNKHIFSPPLTIELSSQNNSIKNLTIFNNKQNELKSKYFIKHQKIRLNLADSETIVKQFFGVYNISDYKSNPFNFYLEILPINLSEHSKNRYLKGQLVVFLLYDEMEKNVTAFSKDLKPQNKVTFNINHAEISVCANDKEYIKLPLEIPVENNIKSDSIKVYFNSMLQNIIENENANVKYSIGGFIYLTGDLRPEVNIARDLTTGILDLETLLHINYAFLATVNDYATKNKEYRQVYSGINLHGILRKNPDSTLVFSELSRILNKNPRLKWKDFDIIPTEFGFVSHNEFKDMLKEKEFIRTYLYTYSIKNITNLVAAFYLQKDFSITVRTVDNKFALCIENGKRMLKSLQKFPTLFFADYKDTEILKAKNMPLNINHVLSRFLVDVAEKIDESFNEQELYVQALDLMVNILQIEPKTHDRLQEDILIPVNQILYGLEENIIIKSIDFAMFFEDSFDLANEI